MLNDLRYAIRMLIKNPGFAAVVILTLALGIGANTSIFTAVNAVLLRPLPVPKPNQLVYGVSNRSERFSHVFYESLRNQAKSFAGVSAVQDGTKRREFLAPGSSAPESASTQLATGNYFAVLGVRPLLGQVFSLDDDRPGSAQPVVVASHAFWQRQLGADPLIVGKTARLSNAWVTIIGVMPPEFGGFQVGPNPDLWAPVQLGAQFDPEVKASVAEDWSLWLIVFGRLRDHISLDQAQAEAQVIFRQQLQQRADTTAGLEQAARERILSQTLELLPGAAGYVSLRSQFKQPLAILMVSVATVLFIACTNVAGLLLARGAGRRRDFAIRAALGAGRARVFRQLLIESLLLSGIGGAGGWIFAQWGTGILARFLAESGNSFALQPDGRVLLFVIGISLLTGVLFGFAPALHLSRLDLVTVIKNQGSRGVAAPSRLQPMLVVMQIVLSVTLLSGAGLLVQTLHNLRTRDMGFQPENVIAFTVSSSGGQSNSSVSNFVQMNAMFRRVLAELGALTGVTGVTIGGGGILSGNSHISAFSVDGYTPAADEEMRASVVLAGPDFFQTLGIPLRGREFMLSDDPTSIGTIPNQRASVAILSKTMALRFFGDSDPIGRFITLKAGSGTRLEVIGVADDTKYSRNLRERPPLEIYQPYFGADVILQPTFYLRTQQSAAVLAPILRNQIGRIDPQLTVGSFRPLDEVIDRLLVKERLIAHLVGFFSIFALLLASLGLYGMLSYGVAQRTREIGVRMALGATHGDVIKTVVRRGLGLTLLGCVVGIGGALFLNRFIASFLYGIRPADPLTFIGVTALFIFVTLLACWLPAHRAAKIDPMAALRSE